MQILDCRRKATPALLCGSFPPEGADASIISAICNPKSAIAIVFSLHAPPSTLHVPCFRPPRQ
jgi:hypothetical protein